MPSSASGIDMNSGKAGLSAAATGAGLAAATGAIFGLAFNDSVGYLSRMQR